MLQNDAKFIQKLTRGFKNHMMNLYNFRQAVQSPKSWNLMGYFCPKNTFLQLKHCIQRIYLTLFSTTFVKIHQITYIIFETVNHFLRHKLLYIFKLKHYILSTKVSHQSANFQTFQCLVHCSPNSSCHFSNKKSVFLQSFDIFLVLWEKILLYFFSLNLICYC